MFCQHHDRIYVTNRLQINANALSRTTDCFAIVSPSSVPDALREWHPQVYVTHVRYQRIPYTSSVSYAWWLLFLALLQQSWKSALSSIRNVAATLGPRQNSGQQSKYIGSRRKFLETWPRFLQKPQV